MVPTDEDNDFGAMLDAFEKETGKPDASKGKKKRGEPKVGDVVTGRVASIGHDAVFVDLGAKAEGMIDVVELRDASGKLPFSVGDSVEAVVVETMGKSGCIVLRRSFGSSRGPKPRGEAALDQLQQAFESRGSSRRGDLRRVNKGGLEVQLATCAPSVPSRDRPRAGRGRDPVCRAEAPLPDHEIERSAAATWSFPARAARRRAGLRAAEGPHPDRPGVVMRGKVSSLKDYGAFAISAFSRGSAREPRLRPRRPSERRLTVGQDVEVQVLSIGPDKTGRERISLSLKSLEKDPWQGIAERFPEGTTLNGKVVRLEPFGAFVELAPGVEGLVHISEIGGGRKVNHPREVMKVGQAQTVTVLGVDAEKRRLSLAPADPDEVGAVATGAPPLPRLGTFGDLLDRSQKPKKKYGGATARTRRTARGSRRARPDLPAARDRPELGR